MPFQIWLCSRYLFTVAVFLSLFAKIRRVYKIFQYRASATRNGVVATRTNPAVGRGIVFSTEFLETVGMIFLVLAVDCLILVWWTILSPLEWRRTVTRIDIFGEPLESQGQCTADNWKVFATLLLVFHLALLCFGSYLCYGEFSRGKSFSSVSEQQQLTVPCLDPSDPRHPNSIPGREDHQYGHVLKSSDLHCGCAHAICYAIITAVYLFPSIGRHLDQ